LNPILSSLGFDPSDRVVVIHADDVGMCQASLDAFQDLLEVGLVTSGSVMTPCPWFPAVAQYCRKNPSVDLGVHLTLNCEWDGYRWAPLSTHDPASGLVDADGYCPKTQQEVWTHADPRSVMHEVETQVSRVIEAGIAITHLDDHMAVLTHPRLLPLYTDFILRQRIPVHWANIPRPEPSNEWKWAAWEQNQRLLDGGFPLFDFDEGLPLQTSQNHTEILRAIMSQLPSGSLSAIIAHPAKDTPELRAIAPDWPGRVANYDALMDRETLRWAKNQGIHLIGMRLLLDALRA
jgi:hypothetical protein